MSDEAETVRDAVGSLWAWTSGQGGKYPDIDHYRALAALDALESQNQALQEALQRALDRYDREDNGTLKVRDGLAWAMAQDLRAALSPTQETDPR